MNRLLLSLILMGIGQASFAQYIYKIKADSVLITNSCDTAELIIENHTQTVPGFLFNKGRGRTEFRKVMQAINDTLVRIGADILRLPNAWVQGGNRWNSTGVFGTMDNNPIDFYTNNARRGRWTSAGNLLIGSEDAEYSQKLQVHGAVKIWDSLIVLGRIVQGYLEEAEMGNGLKFDRAGGITRINAGFNNLIFESQGSGDNFWFRNPGGGVLTGTLVNIDPGPYNEFPEDQLALKVVTRNNIGFVVTLNGRTGVGTMTPSARFHTNGTVRFEGLTQDSSKTRVLVTDADGNLYFRSFSFPTAFNGTMNSDLTVNGTVSAQKMLISQTGRWPDYVFDKQYQLPSLTEVESFINQNNHLPGVPSAADLAKKGIDVADNQAVLLKKIEELTLYAIEQDKKMQKQCEEISELKKQNSELESLKQQMAELKALIINTRPSVK